MTLFEGDSKDIAIDGSAETRVVWAIGGLNDQNQATKHHTRIQSKDLLLMNYETIVKQPLVLDFVLAGSKLVMFGRNSKDNCVSVTATSSPDTVMPWQTQTLSGEDTSVFTARMGAAGGQRGYKAITGHRFTHLPSCIT